MTLAKKYLNLFLLLPVLFFTAFSVTILLSSGTAEAGYGDLATTLPEKVTPSDPGGQYINLSVGGNDPGSGYGASLPDSYLKVYSGSPGARNMMIELTNRNADASISCRNYDIRWTLHRTDPATGGQAGVANAGTININGCTNGPFATRGDYSFTIPAIPGHAPSTKDGSSGLFTSILQLTIIPDVAGATRTATIKPTIASGARLGYAGGLPVTIYPSKSQQFDHEISFKFRAPCTYSNPSYPLFWGDDDYADPTPAGDTADGDGNGTTSQFDDPRVRVHEYDPRSSFTSRTRSNLGLATTAYGNAGTGSVVIDLLAGQSYEVLFNDVDGGNGIAFLYPFDSGDFYIPCPDPLPPAQNATCNNISFNVGSAKRKWYVIVNDGGSQGTYSDNNGDGFPDAYDYEGTANANTAVTLDLVNSAVTTNPGGSTTSAVAGDPKKIVSGTLTYTVIIYNGTTRATGFLAGYPATADKGPCYTATCEAYDVEENFPGAPANGVLANTPFRIYFNIRNTGINDLPSGIPPNYPLGGEIGGGSDPLWVGQSQQLGQAIPRGDVAYSSIVLAAPNDISSRFLFIGPTYLGFLPLDYGGAANNCNMIINTYQRYDFSATAATAYLPDLETLTQAQFTTTLTQQGIDVNGTSTRSFYRERAGAGTPLPGFGPFSETANFGNRNYVDTYNIPADSYQLDDGFCVVIVLDRGHGWRGPSESYVSNTPETADNCPTVGGPGCTGSCTETVVNHPYVRTYGADVATGGGFGTACTNTGSRVLAFMRPLNEQNTANDRSGSGSQLAAMALGQIEGFTSASTRINAPNIGSGKELTFAHDNSVPTGPPLSPQLGGSMTGNGWCMPDYFNETQYPGLPQKTTTSSTADIAVGSLADKKQTLVSIGGAKITLLGNSAPTYTSHHTVYVDGDVFIKNNIEYIASYVVGVNTIPSFTLVARGNIYIDQNVTRLDGLYIAQSLDINGNGILTDAGDRQGRIYTCADADGNPITAQTALFTECGASSPSTRRLTVNGAFIAERVILNRTTDSLRDSRFRECPFIALPSCTTVSRAAEIFNFSPEMYISPPFFSPRSTATSGDYDYVSTLPPIL